LRDAYAPRGQNERYQESADAKWWWRWTGDPKLASRSRWGIWSTTLRTRGDHYRDTQSQSVAASYYEAAIGYPDKLGEPWIDLDALLPLTLIYLQPDAAGSRGPRGVRDIDNFVDVVFMGKGMAYAANDYRRVRYFHMALGQLFAEQRRWGDMFDARSAIFQLERMRRASAAVARETRERVDDPPQLLELLAEGYKATGNLGMARTTAVAAKQGFERLGRAADAARISRRYLSAAAPP
jgi:hypothetical protein